MSDIGITVGVAFLTFVMGFLGVYVTLHPPESPTAKFWWKAAFISCAIVGCGLVALQAYRTSVEQKDLEDSISSLQQSVNKSETGREVDDAYLKAKLEDYKQLQELAPALLKLGQATEGYTQKQYESSVLSKKKLLDMTDDLAAKIRVLGSQCAAKEEAIFNSNDALPTQWKMMNQEQRVQYSRQQSTERSQAYEQNRQQCVSAYRMRIEGDAAYLRRELLSRIGGDSFLLPREKQKYIAIDGIFAGPDPIDDSADYLEALAHKLRQLPPRQQ